MRKTYIDRAISEIIALVNDDTYNLTRDDQDAIMLKVNELKQFIDLTYKNAPKSID